MAADSKMMMNCERCSHHPDPVPFAVHESAMARQERTIVRLWIALLVLIVFLVGSNALWIWYESQWEIVETTSTEIEQNTDGGGDNFIVGGDFNNGKAESQSDEN